MPSSSLPRPLGVVLCCKKLPQLSLQRWGQPPGLQNATGNAALGEWGRLPGCYGVWSAVFYSQCSFCLSWWNCTENTKASASEIQKLPLQPNEEPLCLHCSGYPQGSSQKGGGRMGCGKVAVACGFDPPRAVLLAPHHIHTHLFPCGLSAQDLWCSSQDWDTLFFNQTLLPVSSGAHL